MNINFIIEYNKNIPAIKLVGNDYRNHWIKSTRKNNKNQKVFDFTDIDGWCKFSLTNDKKGWFIFMQIDKKNYTSFSDKNNSEVLTFREFKLEKNIK